MTNGNLRDGSGNGIRGRAGRPPRYSAFDLVRRGLLKSRWPRAWRDHEIRDSYDVVIVGGGVHGLATAYYLARNHGIRNVAVLDKGYLGGGGSGRNTAILRSNYLTPEGVRFYDRSLELYRHLAADLNFNVMFSRRGHLTLAHNDSSLRTMRWRAEVNKCQGVDSEVIDPAEIAKLVPLPRHLHRHALPDPRRALPPARRDRPPRRRGLGLRQGGRRARRPPAPEDRGHRHRRRRTAGSPACRPAGARSPRRSWSTARRAGRRSSRTWRACGPRCRPSRSRRRSPSRSGRSCTPSSCPARCTSTSARPTGASSSSAPASTRSPSYSMRGSLDFVEGLAAHVLELMPALSKMRLLRQWAGLCDMTPDYSPIMGTHPRRGLLPRRRLGHLRVQGRTGVRRGDGRGDRDAGHAGDHRGVRARPVRPRRAGGGEGRRGGGPLMMRLPCPWCGPRNVSEFRYAGEARPRPDPRRRHPRAVARLPVRPGQPTRLGGGDLVPRLRMPQVLPHPARHRLQRDARDGCRSMSIRQVLGSPVRADHRLDPQPGEVIDRSRTLTFTWNGRTHRAHPGDTIVSALAAAGERVFSRSFKYHRPRGLLTASYHDPGTILQVDDEPNVRAAHRLVAEGMRVSSQNTWPSLRYDVKSVNQLVGRFLAPGFYYKTFIKPRAAVAGLREGAVALRARRGDLPRHPARPLRQALRPSRRPRGRRRPRRHGRRASRPPTPGRG